MIGDSRLLLVQRLIQQRVHPVINQDHLAVGTATHVPEMLLLLLILSSLVILTLVLVASRVMYHGKVDLTLSCPRWPSDPPVPLALRPRLVDVTLRVYLRFFDSDFAGVVHYDLLLLLVRREGLPRLMISWMLMVSGGNSHDSVGAGLALRGYRLPDLRSRDYLPTHLGVSRTGPPVLSDVVFVAHLLFIEGILGALGCLNATAALLRLGLRKHSRIFLMLGRRIIAVILLPFSLDPVASLVVLPSNDLKTGLLPGLISSR